MHNRGQARRFSRVYRTVAAGTWTILGAELICGLWPTPGKSPWLLPLAIALLAGLSFTRYRSADGFLLFAVGVVAVSGCAALTLSHWSGMSGSPALVLWLALFALPLLYSATAVALAGALHRPRIFFDE